MSFEPLSATIALARRNQRSLRLKFRATRLESAGPLQTLVNKIRLKIKHHQLEIETTTDEFAESATPLMVVATAPTECADSSNSYAHRAAEALPAAPTFTQRGLQNKLPHTAVRHRISRSTQLFSRCGPVALLPI
jgi:hypothetical protein